jgi:hypothetical protein
MATSRRYPGIAGCIQDGGFKKRNSGSCFASSGLRLLSKSEAPCAAHPDTCAMPHAPKCRKFLQPHLKILWTKCCEAGQRYLTHCIKKRIHFSSSCWHKLCLNYRDSAPPTRGGRTKKPKTRRSPATVWPHCQPNTLSILSAALCPRS